MGITFTLDDGMPTSLAVWSLMVKWPWLLHQTVTLPSGPPVGGGGVGLDVALVHRGGAVLSLDHDVGLPEPGLQVAFLEHESVGHVAGLLGVFFGAQASPHLMLGLDRVASLS